MVCAVSLFYYVVRSSFIVLQSFGWGKETKTDCLTLNVFLLLYGCLCSVSRHTVPKAGLWSVINVFPGQRDGETDMQTCD